MRLVSFNLFRTLGLHANDHIQITHIKPDLFHLNPKEYESELVSADWVLFPEYWQLNSLEYGHNCNIFPSPASYRLGHDKIEMTRALNLVRPQNHPRTYIAKNTALEAERVWDLMELPFVAKLPKASQGNGVWLIQDHADWQRYISTTDSLYVQEYLPIDKDLRIVVVGNEIVAAYWRHQSNRSFHTNVAQGGHISYDAIPQAAIDFVLNLARQLKINHAGFDIAMVGDHPYLIEFNRLFGNQGIPGGGKVITQAMLHYLTANCDDQNPLGPTPPTVKKLPRIA